MIKTGQFMGERGIFLENEWLSAVILPGKGGKVVSLFGKETGKEILFQNKKGRFGQAQFGSSFGDFEACGFDDAFPNVDAETVKVPETVEKTERVVIPDIGEVSEQKLRRKTAKPGITELAYPDHGEIWSASFISEITRQGVSLRYHSARFQYDYRKHFSLHKNRLHCEYEIINQGDRELPCIWTMHCLVSIEKGMRLVFPKGVTQIQNVFACKTLGKAEQIYAFPEDLIQGRTYQFDRIPKSGMVKYYAAGTVKEGTCGYDYPKSGTSVRYFYDRAKLPYLGCWITAGGYRGDWNCALEPCTGYYDSVGKAKRLTGERPVLKKGEKMEFGIEVEVAKMRK